MSQKVKIDIIPQGLTVMFHSQIIKWVFVKKSLKLMFFAMIAQVIYGYGISQTSLLDHPDIPQGWNLVEEKDVQMHTASGAQKEYALVLALRPAAPKVAKLADEGLGKIIVLEKTARGLNKKWESSDLIKAEDGTIRDLIMP